jgi:hypothetical protein
LALLAVCCVATSPVFLFEMMQPMSDVAVTAWWLCAVLMLLRGTRRGSVGAGLAASIAILTRPNIVPLVLPVACLAAIPIQATLRERAISVALFLLACIPGIGLVAASNYVFYGSMSTSGYGSLTEIYRIDGALATTWRYLRWLWDTHSILIFIPLLALAGAFGTRGMSVISRRFAWWVLGFFAVLLACYAPYLRFDHWSYLRFLLPAIPLLMIAAILLVDGGTRTLSPVSRSAVVLFVAIMFPLAYVHTAAKGDAFVMRAGLRHAFEEPAALAAQRLPPNAVFIALTQTGSLRYYGGRFTLRYENIEPARLDALVTYVEARGMKPWAALDRLEIADFKSRFGETAAGRFAFTHESVALPPDGQVVFMPLDPNSR